MIEDIIKNSAKNNLESLTVIDYKEHNSAELLANSLHEIGFAVLTNHDVDNNFVEQVYASWKEFFKFGNKLGFEFDPKTHDGYVSFEKSETAKGSDIKDLKSFYHFYKTGRCPESLKDMTDKLYDQLESMACKLLGSLELFLPKDIKSNLSMPLVNMVKNSGHSLLRPIYYPPLSKNIQKGAMRSAPHEDIDMLTLIAAPSAPGLQVKDKLGNWLDVPCDPKFLVINNGDLLDECTRSFYPSTTHRVINRVADNNLDLDRVSMPLFLHPHNEVRLSEKYTAESFRRERFIELGLIEV